MRGRQSRENKAFLGGETGTIWRSHRIDATAVHSRCRLSSSAEPFHKRAALENSCLKEKHNTAARHGVSDGEEHQTRPAMRRIERPHVTGPGSPTCGRRGFLPDQLGVSYFNIIEKKSAYLTFFSPVSGPACLTWAFLRLSCVFKRAFLIHSVSLAVSAVFDLLA